MTHGWPGSVVELLETVGPLTDPTAHGGDAEDAFHLVLPSIPGYGFSGEPAEVGWDAARIGQAWAELMRRIGYTRYVAQGGDRGAVVTDAMARQAPKGLLGVHINVLTAARRQNPLARRKTAGASPLQLHCQEGQAEVGEPPLDRRNTGALPPRAVKGTERRLPTTGPRWGCSASSCETTPATSPYASLMVHKKTSAPNAATATEKSR
jgi:pimeloyl-ACP methyl ester carboxylesterase